jgi:predicted nucleotidyltransferase
MERDDIIARLRENEAALRARGVAHAALFGSRARGDARPGSDTDIMIEIDPGADVTALKDYIAGLFDGPVDIVDRAALKPYLRPAATTDAVYAFWSMRRALDDILYHIDLAQSFVIGIDAETFGDDLLRLYAVTRCLEIISEASRRLPDAVKARHTSS